MNDAKGGCRDAGHGYCDEHHRDLVACGKAKDARIAELEAELAALKAPILEWAAAHGSPTPCKECGGHGYVAGGNDPVHLPACPSCGGSGKGGSP